MKSRVYTSIIFVAVMLCGVYLSEYTFVVLFGIIASLCLWEFYHILLMEGVLRRILSTLLGIATYVVVAVFQLTTIDAEASSFVTLLLLFIPLVYTFFIYELYSASQKPFHNIATSMLGIVYIGLPFTLLEWIALDDGYQPNIVCGLMILNWINDTAAYLIGSKKGKTLLLPRISPKKTWEGTIGGANFTLITTVGLTILMPQLRAVDWVVLAVIVIVFGTLGDLVESMLKRSLQTKDSGNLLPGHGGLLDRFDSFIFIMPFATLYLIWIR